jgi:LysR family transcriptional regulator for metE and metH
MLELRHLRTLIALAEEGSLTRAAPRLYLSQSALSHQIALLEQQYAAALFERKSHPLRWTPVGQRLLTLAQEVDQLVRDAERDVAHIRDGKRGELRIAVECHSCFDWLMPTMDTFREGWPEVELDLVSGFHADPVALLDDDRADLVIVSREPPRRGIRYHPLFCYEILALLAKGHPLIAKPYIRAEDFAHETLITYPVPDDLLDLVRQVLRPSGINPTRRTTALTVAILQLVASQRGIAALPRWVVQQYLDRAYVVAKPITLHGLQGRLYAATTTMVAAWPYIQAFIQMMKEISAASLEGIVLLTSSRSSGAEQPHDTELEDRL